MDNKEKLEWERKEYIIEWQMQLKRLNNLTNMIHRIDDKLKELDK